MDIRTYFTTFTVTVASPAVFTATDHGLSPGDTIVLETTGTLPTGLSLLTTYYVVPNSITVSTFKLSSGEDGTPIITTGSQSGTQTFRKNNRARLTPNIDNGR